MCVTEQVTNGRSSCPDGYAFANEDLYGPMCVRQQRDAMEIAEQQARDAELLYTTGIATVTIPAGIPDVEEGEKLDATSFEEQAIRETNELSEIEQQRLAVEIEQLRRVVEMQDLPATVAEALSNAAREPGGEDGCQDCGETPEPRKRFIPERSGPLVDVREVAPEAMGNSGNRMDANKVGGFWLIPQEALFEVARTLEMGADKYSPRSWEEGMPWNKLVDGAYRHLGKWIKGERYDSVDGQHHLAAVAWAMFVLMTYEQTHPELDNVHPDEFKD